MTDWKGEDHIRSTPATKAERAESAKEAGRKLGGQRTRGTRSAGHPWANDLKAAAKWAAKIRGDK